MEEQFILRVPPDLAERIDQLLSENASSSEDASLDVSFSEDGRNGTFTIGKDSFPTSLLDLPCILESYKTYDDNVLIKAADIAQIIMVRESSDPVPDGVDYKHGLTPPMRDARRQRFRREPDLNPELVRRVEKDLLSIMAGGTAENFILRMLLTMKWFSVICCSSCSLTGQCISHAEVAGSKKTPVKPADKHEEVPEVAATNTGEPDRSESDDSDDSI
ncbi:hypothetical protein H6P81_011021 [Aristolochia fimbriata]|uniref:TAFII55 protein conserved region domain-containing protein n=1 Tax=Aristolochia fimbriata TaxID=158543 RepID=A0AAV7ERI1_ARIFI|nr:hypothetical protein H6P81_011021 [Aristolochia fimbriata]